MAWAAFMDYLECKLASDGLVAVMRQRPKWAQHHSIEDLRENVVESQLLDVAAEVGLLSKQECKSLKGFLATRNECAHPGPYNPQMNETLGFVAALLNRVGALQTKSPR